MWIFYQRNPSGSVWSGRLSFALISGLGETMLLGFYSRRKRCMSGKVMATFRIYSPNMAICIVLGFHFSTVVPTEKD